MGKYDNLFKDMELEGMGYKSFLVFANELAEANRLKREELDRMEHPTTDVVWNRMEDQA